MGSHLFPIIKTNGRIRICRDNKSTINKYLGDVIYPLPLVDALFASLQGELYTKFDFSKAYNQLNEDPQRCAWSTHIGVLKMSF